MSDSPTTEELPLPCGLLAVYVPGQRSTKTEGTPDFPSAETLRREAAKRSRDRHGGERYSPTRPDR